MEFKMKGSKFYGYGNQSPTKHYVDDVKEHNDGHPDDLQTPKEHKEHKESTIYHFADGTKKSERDKFNDAETKAEIKKEKKAPNKFMGLLKRKVNKELETPAGQLAMKAATGGAM